MNTSQWTSCLTAVLLSGALLLFSATGVMALRVGDKAPDFSLPTTTGEKVGLGDYLGKKHVVLFFEMFAFGGV
jgi:AhpC/TSA family